MKPVLVAFATREGHTKRVADHIASALTARGLAADVVDVRTDAPANAMTSYGGAVLAASIHFGKHEKEMVRFVTSHRDGLEHLPAAFLSISLTEVGAEDSDRAPERRNTAAREVERMMEDFFRRTGWHPARASGVAGALMYSQYNILVRWIMKQIARKEGGSTDTSSDHVYTDWEALDRFVDEFAASLATGAQ